MSGKDGASVCQGDAGGPVFHMIDGRPTLVGINSRSNQVGCFGIESAKGTPSQATGTRVDDLSDWITDNAVRTPVSDFNGDGRSDVGMLYDNGAVTDGGFRSSLWSLTSTGSGFAEPQRKWDSEDWGSWNGSRSKTFSGDFNGDGRGDVDVLYDYGTRADGNGNRTGLLTLTSTGTGFKKPVKVWDSADGNHSWTWARSDIA